MTSHRYIWFLVILVCWPITQIVFLGHCTPTIVSTIGVMTWKDNNYSSPTFCYAHLLAGSVDLLQVLNIQADQMGVSRTTGYCEDRGDVETRGLSDVAFRIDPQATLRVSTSHVYPGEHKPYKQVYLMIFFFKRPNGDENLSICQFWKINVYEAKGI